MTGIFPSGRPRRWLLGLNLLALFAVAIGLRAWDLGRIPGMNGDEAEYGVHAVELLRGEDIPWTTSTGNPINPFFFGPQLGLHSLFEPSFALLRLTAVLSGILAVAVNHWLCRRSLGRQTALLSTVLLAALPLNIAYSRFAWDTCQTLLATVIFVHLSLLVWRDPERGTRWAAYAVLALACAICVHPTNVFLAPLLALALCWRYREDLRALFFPQQRTVRTIVAWSIISVAAIVILWPGGRWSQRVVGRFMQQGEVTTFARNYVRLFSGETVYRYLTGKGIWASRKLSVPGGDFDAHDAAWLILFTAGGLGLYRRWRQHHRPVDAGLLAGWFATTSGFFLVAGPGAIQPHFERYGLCLIVPGILVLARGIPAILPQPIRIRGRVEPVFAALAWFLMLGFVGNYFFVFERTGGYSHDTFRTAEVEPKQQALTAIVRAAPQQAPLYVITSEWWNYWPLKYLGLSHPNVRVRTWNEVPDDPDFPPAVAEGRVWAVEFAGSQFEETTLVRLKEASPTPLAKSQLYDAGGKPVLTILGPLTKK